MIAVHIVATERLGSDRYRLSVAYGEIVVHNIVAMMRDGHVDPVLPPAIRTRECWAPLLSWSDDLREQIRAAAEIAIRGVDEEGLA